MKRIDRRDFLRITLVSASSLMIMPSANGHLLPQKSIRLLRYQLLPPTMTIFQLFVQFATQVVSTIVADHVTNWIQGLTDTGEVHAVNVVDMSQNIMFRAGFVNDDFSQVLRLGDSRYAYPMITRDEYNACAPFINTSSINNAPQNAEDADIIYIEGPTIAGEGVAATDYKNYLEEIYGGESDIPERATGDLFIPQDELSIPRAQHFGTSYNQPAEYETNLGRLVINYEKYPNQRVGLVTVRAIHRNRNAPDLVFEPFEIEFPARYDNVT